MIAERPASHDKREESAPPILLGEVRADMDAIFGAAPDPAGPVAGRTAVVRPLDADRSCYRTSRRRSRTLALIVCAVGGLLLGVVATGGFHLASVRSGSAVRPTAPPMAGVASNPFEVEPATAATGMQQAMSTAATLSRSNTPRKVEGRAVVAKVSATPSPASGRPRETQPVRLAAQCVGDRLERARCMRPDILDADRRLRRAYAEAIRQGVERRFLIEHQRRWARLRNRAIRDPDHVLEGYGELAGALERLSLHGRAANRIS